MLLQSPQGVGELLQSAHCVNQLYDRLPQDAGKARTGNTCEKWLSASIATLVSRRQQVQLAYSVTRCIQSYKDYVPAVASSGTPELLWQAARHTLYIIATISPRIYYQHGLWVQQTALN